jgi:hypothetical protein
MPHSDGAAGAPAQNFFRQALACAIAVQTGARPQRNTVHLRYASASKVITAQAASGIHCKRLPHFRGQGIYADKQRIARGTWFAGYQCNVNETNPATGKLGACAIGSTENGVY